ncbi:hypothetical protein BCT69_06225 [Enterovibrio norvegicus]|nr:hypothetical protein BCT69_06225 [Enterovibrio norvegicus]
MNYCFSSLLILNDEDLENIHPSDQGSVKFHYPSGWQRRCFEYLGSINGYEYLRDGEITIRVKNAYVEHVSEPKFKVGEIVLVNRKGENGVIEKMHWHTNKIRPIYTVSVKGVLSGYQYFDDDLTAIV